MIPLDFIIYAVGFIGVGILLGFAAGLAAGSTFMFVRLNETVRSIDDNDLGREESQCR